MPFTSSCFVSRFDIAAATLLVASATLHAETLDVPAQYSTITEAIAAAEEGDVVQVAAGTYVERINSAGKAIRIRGAVDGADKSVKNRGAAFDRVVSSTRSHHACEV